MVFHSKLPVNQITPGHLFARLIRHRGSSLEIGWENMFFIKILLEIHRQQWPSFKLYWFQLWFRQTCSFYIGKAKIPTASKNWEFPPSKHPKMMIFRTHYLPGSPTCVVLGDMSFRGAKLSEGILRYRNRVWKMNFPFESAKELIFILVSA